MSKINLVYYNDGIRCYRNGQVERYWKRKGWQIVENNDNHYGYNRIEINKKMILRHRIIAYCFLLASLIGLHNIVGNYKGDDVIDHKDHNKLNNSVKNLRITDGSGNQQNQKNVKGYYFNKQKKKYQAQILVDGKQKYLGSFIKEEDAAKAVLEGIKKYHTAID